MKMKIYQSFVMAFFAGAIAMISGCSESDLLSPHEQFQKDQQAIDKYISDNDLDVEIEQESEMRYQILSTGTGDFPADPDSIVINSVGKVMATGKVFDELDTVGMRLFRQITGWRIGLPLVSEGGSIRLFVPSGYGFGPGQLGEVPGNSNLIFDIEIVKVFSQLKKDLATIDLYLEANEIEAQIDAVTDMRYVIVEPGDGKTPTPTSTVMVNYVGKLMSNGSEFDKGNGHSFALPELVRAWRIGMPKISEGGKIIMYVPSSYGYGPYVNGPIPAYSNLIFEVELLQTN